MMVNEHGKKIGLGSIREKRHHHLAVPSEHVVSFGPLPQRTNWWSQVNWMPATGQAGLGSCGGNTCVHGMQAVATLTGQERRQVSALYAYQRACIEEGHFGRDQGCSVGSALAQAKTNGICLESVWPFNPANFVVTPPPNVDADAARQKLTTFASIATFSHDTAMAAVKTHLAAGHPCTAHLAWYNNYFDVPVISDGILRRATGASVRGGHAVLVVDYDDAPSFWPEGVFRFINSMGSWGDQGWGWIPYSWLWASNTENTTGVFWSYYAFVSVSEIGSAPPVPIPPPVIVVPPIPSYNVTQAQLDILQSTWKGVTVPTITQAQIDEIQGVLSAITGTPTPTHLPEIQVPRDGPSLTYTDGSVWSFGTASLAPYGKAILRNGALAASGWGVLISFVGGQLKHQNGAGTWWLWTGSGWSITQAPTLSTSAAPIATV